MHLWSMNGKSRETWDLSLKHELWDTHPIDGISSTWSCDLDVGGVHGRITSIPLKNLRNCVYDYLRDIILFELTSNWNEYWCLRTTKWKLWILKYKHIVITVYKVSLERCPWTRSKGPILLCVGCTCQPLTKLMDLYTSILWLRRLEYPTGFMLN